MKNSMWIVGVLIITFFQLSCSKSKGPNPEDTALIRGTDRGTFIGSTDDLAQKVEMNFLQLVQRSQVLMVRMVSTHKILF